MNSFTGRTLRIVGLALLSAGCMLQPEDLDQTIPPGGTQQESPPVLLDVFPGSVMQVPADQRGETKLSSTYTPTDSSWGKGLNEEDVFHYEIKHLQEDDNSFTVRIGKGGQLYSLRGAFGESIPPQGPGNPWNDEVWQFVAVCSPYNNVLKDLVDSGALSTQAFEQFEQSSYQESYFIHNSGAYMQAPVDSGRITVSCDVMLDKEKPGAFQLMLRDASGPPWKNFANVHVAESGITYNGVAVAPAQAGQWYHVELAFDLSEGGGDKGIVRVKMPDGKEAVAEAPHAEAPVKNFPWLGLLASGNEAGIINIDNLSVKRDMDGQVEWPVQEDFDEYEPGQPFADTGGADEEKGAVVFVSDRFAASGKNSLEIHDAPGLEAAWQPMVRVDVQSNLGGALYCPLLAAHAPGEGRSYRTVNWGFVPQLKTIHRSPLLYYVQTRDVGDGVIEVTYVVHNFSARDDIVFDWLNAPWGGTRVTSLPFHYVGSPEGELWDTQKIEELNIKNGFNVRDTGGWNLSCAGESPDSPSLALVFGRDRHLEAERERAAKGEPFCQVDSSIYRDWTSRFPGWEKRKENTWRNYDVAVVIPRFRLAPGTSIWYRSFLVVNRKDRAIELAQSLVDQVDYGLRVFDPEATPMAPVQGSGLPAFELFAHPVPGSMPLFVIENESTGDEVVTTDPYIFVPQEELGLNVAADHPKADYYNQAVGYSLDENNSNWKRLLGYGCVEKPASGNWVRLSSLLSPGSFPEPNSYHLDLWVHMPVSE